MATYLNRGYQQVAESTGCNVAQRPARYLDASYETAFVLALKIRGVLGRETLEREVSGVVEDDSGYFGPT